MKITVEFNSYAEINDFCNGVVIAPALLELEEEQPKPAPKKAKKSEKVETNAPVVEEPKAKPVVENPMPEPIEEKEEVKELAIEDVRSVLGKLQKDGKKEEVKELIASFGVDKLSQIKSEDYAELIKKAGEL